MTQPAPPCKPRKRDPIPKPGDDVVPVPASVTEEPPQDSFCDIVLTGGVASGVVYPWAIVELARHFRFRNIGGNSVGAMAAALAAAAEYGRRVGYEDPFEALRRAPASLAELYPDKRTRMLSLFQTNPDGRRLIWLWGQIFCGNPEDVPPNRCPPGGKLLRGLKLVGRAYRKPLAIGAGIGFVLGLAFGACSWLGPIRMLILGLSVALLGSLLCFGRQLWRDLKRGLIDNCYGLCKGGNVDPPDGSGPPGITQWLHDGIQASAGLGVNDPPLTFGDLWTAPRYPGAGRTPCSGHDPEARRAINLVLITTNVTHGRPYRLPLTDRTARLFFKREELKDYFPCNVLDALVLASKPYAPADPKEDPPTTEATAQGLRELPDEGLPVVVAARLSLSFPLLFSAVPLWAIDFEAPEGARTLRRCIFTDGGLSSNFPIHLFDTAVPRWPTFGLWLDERGPYRWNEPGAAPGPDGQIPEQEVWLPEFNEQGRRDNWTRFDPQSKAVDPVPPPLAPWKSTLQTCPQARPSASKADTSDLSLLGFLGGLLSSAKDWRDRTNFRMAHVRNRVARLYLLPGEGGLNIGMPRKQILDMAYRYGTRTGQLFVERFKAHGGQPAQAWNEQRWIRFNVMVNGLREALDGLRTGADWSARTVPLREAIEAATVMPGPVRVHGDGHRISTSKAGELKGLLSELERLEGELLAAAPAFRSPPEPELRLRPPL